MPLTDIELQVTLAFASVELAELRCGKREIANCPGLATLGAAVHEAQAFARHNETDSKNIYLRIHERDGDVTLLGDWPMAWPDDGRRLEDIARHIVRALYEGARSVEVIYGDRDADYASLAAFRG